MGEVTTVVAGLMAAAGAVAVYRYARKRLRAVKSALREAAGVAKPSPVLDFERDPASGVFRVK